MKRFVIALLALLATPAAAQRVTPDWRAISFIGQGDDEGVAMIDIASLSRPSANVREIRAATVSERPETISGQSVAMTQIVYRFDCTARTFIALRTEAWTSKGRVIASDRPGPARKIDAGTIMEDVRAAICDDAFGALRRIPGANPTTPALALIVQRQSLVDSRGRGGWQRLTDSGDAPDRMQYFAERGSVISDPAGGELVSTMVLIEKGESGITRIHYLVRVDCKARTGETLFAQAFGDDGRLLSEVLLSSGPQPLEPGRMAGALEVPVCKGDWGSGAPEIRLPDQLAREAFH